MVGLEFLMGRLSSDALASVPNAINVANGSVGVAMGTVRLTLTKILNGSKHVALNGSGVFNSLFNDDCLRE